MKQVPLVNIFVFICKYDLRLEGNNHARGVCMLPLQKLAFARGQYIDLLRSSRAPPPPQPATFLCSIVLRKWLNNCIY